MVQTVEKFWIVCAIGTVGRVSVKYSTQRFFVRRAGVFYPTQATLQRDYSNQGHPAMKFLDVNNTFLTNKQSKQAAHHRINTFVTIFIVSTRKCYRSICKEFAWVALDCKQSLFCSEIDDRLAAKPRSASRWRPRCLPIAASLLTGPRFHSKRATACSLGWPWLEKSQTVTQQITPLRPLLVYK